MSEEPHDYDRSIVEAMEDRPNRFAEWLARAIAVFSMRLAEEKTE